MVGAPEGHPFEYYSGLRRLTSEFHEIQDKGLRWIGQLPQVLLWITYNTSILTFAYIKVFWVSPALQRNPQLWYYCLPPIPPLPLTISILATISAPQQEPVWGYPLIGCQATMSLVWPALRIHIRKVRTWPLVINEIISLQALMCRHQHLPIKVPSTLKDKNQESIVSPN